MQWETATLSIGLEPQKRWPQKKAQKVRKHGVAVSGHARVTTKGCGGGGATRDVVTTTVGRGRRTWTAPSLRMTWGTRKGLEHAEVVTPGPLAVYTPHTTRSRYSLEREKRGRKTAV